MAAKDRTASHCRPGHGQTVSSTSEDCLIAAVNTLAGHGPLKDRLAAAWAGHLETLDPLLLPGDVRAEFNLLGALLHGVRALPGDTVVRASVRKLSHVEAGQCAEFIVRALASVVAHSTQATLEAAATRVAALARNAEAEAVRDEESVRVPALRIAGAG